MLLCERHLTKNNPVLTDSSNATQPKCNIVATYPEVIRNNLDTSGSGDDGAEREPELRLLTPFLNLANRDYLPERLLR